MEAERGQERGWYSNQGRHAGLWTNEVAWVCREIIKTWKGVLCDSQIWDLNADWVMVPFPELGDTGSGGGCLSYVELALSLKDIQLLGQGAQGNVWSRDRTLGFVDGWIMPAEVRQLISGRELGWL